MARFKYTGRDIRGKRSGVINAANRREAMEKLKKDSIRVIEISQMPETLLTKDLSIGNPVKLEHFVIYLRQFSTLIKAGVTVVDATNILSQQTDSKALARTLQTIETDLRDGKPLSAAAAKHKKIFPPMVINMIKAGEIGGNLDDTLDRLAIHYEKQHDTKRKISSALAYPIVIAIVAIAVVIFLLVKVVPTYVSMFADFGGELPAITQFVLKASEMMQAGWYFVVLFILLVIGAIHLIRQNKKTKYYFDYFLLKTPIFGSMIQKAALARMTRTLSSLFSSSVPILESMTLVEQVVENEVIGRVVLESRDSLERGQSLTGPMKTHWAFPPLITQMISIGETTGSLEAMLTKVAEFYEKEVEASTDKLKALIEPLMIVFLASLVGTIVLAIIVPMFTMFNQISG